MIAKVRRQRGFTMVEVMLAMFILAVGLLACTGMVVAGMASNSRNQNDSGATLVSQMVIEQLNSTSANASINGVPITIAMTDCAGNAWTMKTTAGAQPGGAGANFATLDTNNPNGIDFLQAATAIPDGYHMNYVMCASKVAREATYDVRWNIMTLTPSTNVLTVSARQIATANGKGLIYARPVTLRTIQGQ